MLATFSPLGYLAEVIDSGKPVQIRAHQQPLPLHIEPHPHASVSHRIADALSDAENTCNLRSPAVVRSFVELPANHIELALKFLRSSAQTVAVSFVKHRRELASMILCLTKEPFCIRPKLDSKTEISPVLRQGR